MNCKNCKHWVWGRCKIIDEKINKEALCNAWELSLSHEQVGEMQREVDKIAELQARIAKLEAFIAKILEVGCALEMEAYDAWCKDGMLDFPAAEVWHTLAQDWKEREE